MRRDALLAVVLLLVGEIAVIANGYSWTIGALTVVWSVPLAFRRRWPLAVVAIVVAGVGAAALADSDASQIAIPVALLVVAYTGGRELDPPHAWFALAVIIAPFWIAALAGAGEAADVVFGTATFGVVWGAGQGLRRREREAERAERAAIEAERTRIARELHDIVSHSLSVVVVQSQAVRKRLHRDQPDEDRDLRAIETTARQALAEMRRLFGVLRADGEGASLAPQPGLDQLDELVGQSRAAGMPVDVAVEGDRVPLPPGVDLAAYRIVQEALSNARRHAGPARASVRLRYRDSVLEVVVDDDGSGGEASNGAAGHGLAGMRERVRVYGGSLDAGPRPDGGFRVRAEVPFRR